MSIFEPSDKPRLATEYYQGLKHLHNGDYEAALECFRHLDISSRADHFYKSRYQAYHGLSRICHGDRAGIVMCRIAGKEEDSDGEVFYCLAVAENKLNNRQRAVLALLRGLQIEPTHPDILRMREIIGVRRQPVLSFLDRNHLLNRLLGKLTYRRAPVAGRGVRCE